MPSGERHETPEAAARLEAARGSLRDAMGGVRNLARLLPSLRVGARSIERVLPHVRESCAALETSSHALLEDVAAELGERGAIDTLLAWFDPRIHELERELALSQSKPLNAKARLALEQVVTRLEVELEAGRALVDLFDEAVRGAHVRLDLGELLRNARPSREESELVEVRVSKGLLGEALINPRVCSLVLGMGGKLVKSRGGEPSVSASEGPSGRSIVIEHGDGGGERVSLPVLPLVPPTLACVSAIARACSARLEWDERAPRFSLALGR